MSSSLEFFTRHRLPCIGDRSLYIYYRDEEIRAGCERLSYFPEWFASLVGGGSGSLTQNRCMYLGGPGGTGKPKVIRGIVALFDRIGCPEKLVRSATTSMAVDIINGSTILSLHHLSRGNKGNEDVGRVERMNFRLHLDNGWTNCEFLCHRRNVNGWLSDSE